MAGEGWEQTPANRFRHSQGYLRACAEQSGFAVTEVAQCALRSGSHTPVEGFAVALRKAAKPPSSPSSA
jgi:predicted TPR repeat methyltransferase